MKKNLFEHTKQIMKEHAPEILTGIGVAGMVVTTVLAVKATPKALKLMEEKKEELQVRKLSAGEVIKTTWKCYVPAAVSCVASASCLIGANTIHVKRFTALAAAYELSTTALTEYREKVIETIGEKKERDVHDALMKEKVNKTPVTGSEVILTGGGETLCCDAISERYFKSSRDEIVRCINEVNRRMNLEGYVSLNDLYRELGLFGSKIGETVGWKAEGGMIEPRFSTQLADDHRTPCLVLDFFIPPKYGYDK